MAEATGEDAAPGGSALPDQDTALASLVLMLGFLHKPADPEQLRHAAGKGGAPLEARDLLRLAKQLDVRARETEVRFDRLQRQPLPAIASDKDGGFFLLLQASEDKALVFHPSADKPEAVALETLRETFSGRLILMTTRERLAGAARTFDVTWFIPSIVKYGHLLRDVLLASFFIQLLALVSPLFFQIVIDKVLVHNGLTTLEVLAIGFLVVSVFDVLMGGLRTYLFSHTTSRVDAELGSRLFHHLTHLPMAYFQARRVGDSVARVRELETIREFLTSSALTVVIDLFFAIIFLIVMWLYSSTLIIIVLITLPLYALILILLSPILRRRLDEKFARGAENQAFLVESVTGIETIKAHAVEPQMQQRWEQQLAGYIKSGFSASMIANWGRQAIELVQKLSTVGLLFFGAKLVIEGKLTVGELVAFNMLAGQAAGPVLRIAHAIAEADIFQRNMAPDCRQAGAPRRPSASSKQRSRPWPLNSASAAATAPWSRPMSPASNSNCRWWRASLKACARCKRKASPRACGCRKPKSAPSNCARI